MICTSKLEAQNIESGPVNFVIKKIHNQLFNDTILVRMLLEYEYGSEGESLTGRAVLNMCSCYCDSIWDAWPSSGNVDIPGTGTMHFISDGNPQTPQPLGPQNGVIGILGVEGGIERETEFNLWSKILWDQD